MIGEILILGVIVFTLILLIRLVTMKAPDTDAFVIGCGYCIYLLIWLMISIIVIIIAIACMNFGW